MDRIEGPPSNPRVWIDATTLQRVGEGNPVGLMRVEGGLIANCFARLPDRSGLFAYDRRAGRMVAGDPAVLSAGAGSAARRLRRSGWLRDLGRRTESAIRQMLRAVIGDMLRWGRSRAAAPPPHTTPGDVVLCLGETWAVHDLDVLRAWTPRDGLVYKGILNPVKGVQGGYELDLERKKSMKLVDVLLAIEGKGFTNRCILGLEACSSVHPCALHAHVQVVKGHLHRIFNETTLFDLIDRPVEQIMAATLN